MDDSWMNDFLMNEKEDKYFYADDIKYIQVFALYVSNDMCLDKIKERIFHLQTNNIISKEELKELITSYKSSNDVVYKLISIIKHNIDMPPENIEKSVTDGFVYDYTSPLSTIDMISLNKSANIFEDLNSLFLIFYESNSQSNNTTKRIKLRNKVTHKNTTKKRQIKHDT